MFFPNAMDFTQQMPAMFGGAAEAILVASCE
jgi:hypothetical protein